MGVLVFVCPANGKAVSTKLDIDAGSFSSVLKNRLSQVQCPHCKEPHELSQVACWLSEESEARRSGTPDPIAG